MNVHWMETTSSTNPPFLITALFPPSLWTSEQLETDSLQQAVADPDNRRCTTSESLILAFSNFVFSFKFPWADCIHVLTNVHGLRVYEVHSKSVAYEKKVYVRVEKRFGLWKAHALKMHGFNWRVVPWRAADCRHALCFCSHSLQQATPWLSYVSLGDDLQLWIY